MKHIIKLFRRKPDGRDARRDKKGNSLAFVMMVGAALVIWVMCILPLMTTTGTTAYKTQASQADYLNGRSSIEFCKSELEKIVEDKVPYTFAVTGNSKDKYTATPKRIGNTLNPDYSAMVQSVGYDDSQETPRDNAAGKTVTAICEVTANADNPNAFDLTITTYSKGAELLTYTAVYTPSGSLMINPEAYKQHQALPLSNFVLVDGKLGDKTIWDSSITMSNYEGMDFTENMLKFMLPEDRPAGYADAGRYPIVFKSTAHAAVGEDSTIGEAITIGELTSDNSWIMPKAGEDAVAGSIRYTVTNSTVTVQLYDGGWKDISGKCTVYFNGTSNSERKVPSKPGYYTVTVDFDGIAADSEDGVNFLPIKGLELGTIDTAKEHGENKVDTSKKITIQVDKTNKGTTYNPKYTYTITLQNTTSGLTYGWKSATLNSDGEWKYSSNVTWLSSTSFTVEEAELAHAYFFYAYAPSSYSEGKVVTASGVELVGMMYQPQFVSELDDLKSGDEYIVVGEKNSKYYALKTGNNNTLGTDTLSQDDGFVTTDADLKTWIVTKNGNNNPTLSIATKDGKYLTLDGEAYCEWKTKTTSHKHSNNNYKNCTEYYAYSGVNCELNLSDSYAFQMTSNNGRFTLFDQYVLTDSHDKYGCSYNYNQKVNVSINEKRYLSLSGSASASSSSASVKFMLPAPKTPATPSLPIESHEYTGNTTVAFDANVTTSYIKNNISNNSVIQNIYANGDKMISSTKLNAGKYEIVVEAKKSGGVTYYAALGTITVTKANLPGQPSINASTVNNDDFGIKVTGSNWNSNGGVRYFGYKAEDESEYHWYSTTESAFTFRLLYGKYNFAIMESGTTNYNGTAMKEYDGLIELKAAFVADDKINLNKFVYTYDSATNETIWYELPQGVNPALVHLVFGTEQADGTIIWSKTYSPDIHYHGVIIDNSNYNDLNHVLKLTTPVGITAVNGHYSSMISGTSMYFMAYTNSGSNPSAAINTWGNDIYLKTDLLVLNGDITGGGKVSVEPYTEGEDKPGYTLLYVSKSGGITLPGGKTLSGRTFYKVPKGTDLCMLNAMDSTVTEMGTVDTSNIKYMFRQELFPVIDLDIAYATKSQIAHVISSETNGWTDEGTLIQASGANDNANSKFLISMYVTDISSSTSEIKLLANRIMIAAEQTHRNGDVVTTSHTLTVPKNLTLTTRYVSIDADQICQGSSSSKFIINNLGENSSYLSWLKNLSDSLGFTTYVSKTLQIDYERFTGIYNSSNNLIMSTKARIYRLDDGVNLFVNPTNEELMVTYTPDELESYGNLLSSTLKTVDRYISISSNSGSSSIDFGSIFGSDYKPYANYIYFDSNISSITFSGLSSGGIYVNTMESGYSNQEYLGLFSNKSSENYTGTILYFARDMDIKVKALWGILGTDTYRIPSGFYHVDATSGGTNLIDIAKDVERNGQNSQYVVTQEELRQLSVYIKNDGTLSNAYVDTGIFDSESATIGGFSGGNME